jgi:hypothetical protein
MRELGVQLLAHGQRQREGLPGVLADAQTPNGPTFIELGQGAVDLVDARDEALRHPLDWIVCEQDRIELEPRDSIRRSFGYLKQVGLEHAKETEL